jgi:hypothetical protein
MPPGEIKSNAASAAACSRKMHVEVAPGTNRLCKLLDALKVITKHQTLFGRLRATPEGRGVRKQ